MLFLASTTIFSQSQRYNNLKEFYRGLGYTIGIEQHGDAVQSGTVYSYLKFNSGFEYIIVAIPDDADVLDIDLFTYYDNGLVFLQDNDNTNLALVRFTCTYTSNLKIVAKNYRSITPSYASKIRYFVAYK